MVMAVDHETEEATSQETERGERAKMYKVIMKKVTICENGQSTPLTNSTLKHGGDFPSQGRIHYF